MNHHLTWPLLQPYFWLPLPCIFTVTATNALTPSVRVSTDHWESKDDAGGHGAGWNKHPHSSGQKGLFFHSVREHDYTSQSSLFFSSRVNHFPFPLLGVGECALRSSLNQDEISLNVNTDVAWNQVLKAAKMSKKKKKKGNSFDWQECLVCSFASPPVSLLVD